MKVSTWILCIALSWGVLGAIFPAEPGDCAGIPKKGDTLPAFKMQAPDSEKTRAYLGVTQEAFRISDLPCRLLLLEIIGVYCPQCYQQAPLFNNIYNRIEKSKFKGQIKMLALATGATDMEIAFLQKEQQYAFPILSDPTFDIHKMLGEPRTPFTMLIDPNGKILHTHMGVMEDMDALWKMMTEIIR
jgi:peroxiredoxin